MLKTSKLATLFYAFFTFCYACLDAQHFQWVTGEGAAADETATASAIDPNGNIHVTGYFMANVDFDPGPGTYNIYSYNYGTFIQVLDSNQNLIRVSAFPGVSGLGQASGRALYIDAVGNEFLAGNFFGTMDFDPGPGVFNLTSDPSVYNLFLLKLDASGTFQWAVKVGGPTTAITSAISGDASGNVFIAGTYEGTTDFDPGAGTFNMTASGSIDGFVLKLDPSGNFLWAFSLGSNSYEYLTDMEVDPNGNVIIGGHFNAAIDFDPGPGVDNRTPSGWMDYYLAKYDGSGNYLWAKTVGGTGGNELYSLTIDPSGNIYFTGNFYMMVDFDPGPGVYNLTVIDSIDSYISALDASGNFLWANALNGVMSVPGEITLDANNYLYLTGYFIGTMDCDPSPGVLMLSCTGFQQAFFAKYNSSGSLIWAGNTLHNPGVSGGTGGYGISVFNTGSVYVTGGFKGSCDFDPGTGIDTIASYLGSEDIFILKLGQDSCSTLALGVDTVAEMDCNTLLGYALASATGGLGQYTWAWSTIPVTTTPAANFSSAGIYNVSLTDANGCTSERSILMNGPTFPAGFDLRVNMHSQFMVPGDTSLMYLDGFNDGCTDQSGQMRLILHPLNSLYTSVPTPDVISGDTLLIIRMASR